MSKRKASDILARMRETAMREKPVQVSEPSEQPPDDAQPEEPRPTQPERRIRFTLDLTKTQHKFLKTFALEAERDASSVVRALLTRLEQDKKLAEEVLTDLSA